MSSIERIYRIDNILANRISVSKDELMQQLGVSWATLKRDLAYLRDRLNAPVVFDRELNGYRMDRAQRLAGQQYELPGLWFSAEEIHALLSMQHLLANLGTDGLLGPHIRPLQARLAGLLGTAENKFEEVQKRIRVQTVGARRFHLQHFQAVGSALLRRQRLHIRYHSRSRDETTEREISPQRLVYYRDNWYLDAWCHVRDALRAFSVDGIERADILDKKARDIAEKRLDEELGSGYGIFSGATVCWAVLEFSAERARWVASEQWHPVQEGKLLDDGRYRLRLPYSDERELVMDIMKYGGDCQVIEPPGLVDYVRRELQRAIGHYQHEKS